MTQEEKAKAYDEALERADSLTEKYGGREFAEYIFPELAESDDERIRKQLIDAIKIGRSNSGISFTEEAASRYIAWLEKQKEQKVDIDKLRRDLYQSGYNDGYQHGKEDAQKEQKPAEWSEDIIRKAVKEVGLTQHQINWFKSNVFPPKPEWSEEDEDTINLSPINTPYIATISTDMLIKRIESLRPHWKPSEEQMEALNKARRFIPYNCDILESLYEQLQKL